MDFSTLRGRKILVVGRPCSGKTTFAKRLAEAMRVPLHDLDDVYWNGGWERTTEERFMEKLKGIVVADEWIVSGNYMPTLPFRLRHCTDVVVLDSAWYQATFRYLRRIARRVRGRERHAAYAGFAGEFRWKFFVGKILLYSRHYREFESMLAGAPASVAAHRFDAGSGRLLPRTPGAPGGAPFRSGRPG